MKDLIGYEIMVRCLDCGSRHDGILTLRFPLKDFRDLEVIDLLKCWQCSKSNSQYIVKFEEIPTPYLFADPIVQKNVVEQFKQNEEVRFFYPPKDIERVGEVRIGLLYISKDKISVPEAERRDLKRKLKKLNMRRGRGREVYYKPHFRSNEELGPETIHYVIAKKILDQLDQVKGSLGGEVAANTELLEKIIQGLEENQPCLLYMPPPENAYFVVSKLPDRENVFVVIFNEDDPCTIVEEHIKERFSEEHIKERFSGEVRQLPLTEQNIEKLRKILELSRL